jgi:Raf kinase inhibitor-like YbhB/YbcL family protein
LKENADMALSLSSAAFANGGPIPGRYTCDGEDVSPPLSWTGAPATTESFVLLVDDPDAPDPQAPRMTWIHWVLYNLPADCAGLPKAVDVADLPSRTRQGLNDWKRVGYGGPCPPIGAHRYFHKLYALDTLLPDLSDPVAATLEQAMRGHVVAEAVLTGTYQREA